MTSTPTTSSGQTSFRLQSISLNSDARECVSGSKKPAILLRVAGFELRKNCCSPGDVRLHVRQYRLGESKELSEGSLKSGHHVREKKLQNDDRETQAYCAKDTHSFCSFKGEISCSTTRPGITKRIPTLPGYERTALTHAGRLKSVISRTGNERLFLIAY